MKKTLFICAVFFMTAASTFAQNLNSYKYVVVPNRFEFLKESNQYQLNELTKFLFEKYNFKAFFNDEEISEEFGSNRCSMLYADVIDNSGLFSTKLQLILRDCNNKQVFVSEEGTSKIKEFKKAYHEALREVFESVEALNYAYVKETIPEVVEQLPEKNEVAVAVANEEKMQVVDSEKPAAKEVPSKKETAPLNSGKKVASAGKTNFEYEGNSFYLLKSNEGFKFYQEGMAEPFAALIASGREGNFIYSSIGSQGTAYFGKEGNLVVEFLNSDKTSVVSKKYVLKD
ncbi:hypothetical protein L1I30_11300 [Gillisia sp. M10.2A]|uniref:Uncharacterized protein n=1 Tax=Gillisia lutea TaxID=2909668 RepID=A0ABS9EKB9_9FLAO|nr:hypothetical protein [Gillisia lutea]MCF4102255.1 hypothetical protein [Gillisia lutea]